MATTTGKARLFLELHRTGQPLLLPNPWDVGSAKILAALGFEALATTSAGFAATVGRLDGNVTREEAVTHGAAIAAATPLPVSADLENGFGDSPAEVATTVTAAIEAGLAGCSIEDSTGDPANPIYDIALAVDRVAAAAAAASAGDGLVLTARSENYLHGRADLGDTIARLQAFQEAGADVLYAPGVISLDDIRAVVTAVDRPVNVLALPGVAPVADLAAAGVARISIGSGFAWVAAGALVEAATELRDRGTYDYWKLAGKGASVARSAFKAG